MITGPLRSKIDKLWEDFWTGGITNPLTVIEQISFLMFARLLDIRETRAEKKWGRANKGQAFAGEMFKKQQHLRWSNLIHEGDADRLMEIVGKELFPHIANIAGDAGTFGRYLKGAHLMVQKASLLSSAIRTINELPLTEGDTKGDLYEYLLSKLTTAGINGQFRTPRHVIDLMVQLMAPQPEEVVADPACGTAGFLVGTMQYLLQQHTSKEGQMHHEDNGNKSIIYSGDELTPLQRKHIAKKMFHGFEFDVTMLRIAAMNMMLHGVDTPNIHYQDTLSNSFPENFGKEAEGFFDVILANPPFKGSLDYSDVHPSLTGLVKTKKTELLFVTLILKMLKAPGGRCAVVVPDGVLFGTSKAHVALRQMLVEDNQLDGVISLPSGVFKPYAGVSTGILLFTKGGQTKDVFFYDVTADGYSLDDKRDKIDVDDLPDCLAQWKKRGGEKKLQDRKAKAFLVPKGEIAENKYDLSINRYKEVVYEEVKYDPPKVIIAKLRKLEKEIATGLDELEGML